MCRRTAFEGDSIYDLDFYVLAQGLGRLVERRFKTRLARRGWIVLQKQGQFVADKFIKKYIVEFDDGSN